MTDDNPHYRPRPECRICLGWFDEDDMVEMEEETRKGICKWCQKKEAVDEAVHD